MVKPIKVLIVDDQSGFRMVLSALLRRLPNVVVVGEACDGIDAIEMTAKLDPDIILMDITMPRCDGLDATRILKSRWPSKKVVIASMHEHPFYRIEAKRSKADGFILKSVLDASLRKVFGQGVSLLGLANDVVDVHDVSTRCE
jgi:DNA-binding NarL/FixJ family response regulator